MYQMAIRQENQAIKGNVSGIYSNLLLCGAVGGVLLGIILSLVGIFLSIEVFLTPIETHRLEVVLLISAFGFFFFGTHCMDKIDKIKKAQRIERCERYGMPKGNKQ